MPEAQRNEMIRGMVAQLAARLNSQPDDVEGWLRLGRSYEVLDDNAKSIEAFEHALRLRPDDVGIQLATFDASVAGLQPVDPLPPRAKALLRQIASARPDQPQVLWYLGIEAARTGHADEARQKWTRLLGELPPGSDDAKLVQSALNALPAAKQP
jgi:cytochrome c-type biogenesis protein CcmH